MKRYRNLAAKVAKFSYVSRKKQEGKAGIDENNKHDR